MSLNARRKRIMKHFDTVLADAVDRGALAGAVALVIRRGQVVYSRTIGWRDAEARIPMTEDSLFRIASMTKPVTSVAVMALCEEGKIGLEDPISQYIPELAKPRVLVVQDETFSLVPAEREITIHDLLTHTAGISYRLWDRPHLGRLYAEADIHDGLSESTAPLKENVARLARLPLWHQPGAGWEYGLSTDVLGRLVEVVSCESLDSYFRRRIFQPLGIKDTGFLVPADQAGRLAALYTQDTVSGQIRRVGPAPVREGQIIYSSTYASNPENRYFSGGAGLTSTVGDYARFLQMLLNGGEVDGHHLLRPTTVEQMTRHQIGSLRTDFPEAGDGFGYGFGIVTGEDSTATYAPAGSYSWGGAFGTYFWVDPSHDLFGVLMTQLLPRPTELRQQFTRHIYATLME
jgi:CubicO group peptidase (beta-lactamase class C family)